MANTTRGGTKLGYAEYVCFPNDGRRHEVIDGEHYLNPAPNPYHQTVSKRLQHQLYTTIELAGLGIVFDAPIDLQLSDYDMVQPDLVVIVDKKKSVITPTRIKGSPDLLVEILSPSSADQNRRLKRSLYERRGVREYWIVDPMETRVVQLVRRQRTFLAEPHEDLLHLSFLDQVSVDLRQVW